MIIPNYMTVIGNEAFSSCGSVTSIKIPNNVTEIREKAFNGCSSLEELHLRIKIRWTSLLHLKGLIYQRSRYLCLLAQDMTIDTIHSIVSLRKW